MFDLAVVLEFPERIVLHSGDDKLADIPSMQRAGKNDVPTARSPNP
jgi:hypothetical protein